MTGRLVGLDVLRAIALISVLIGHAPVAATHLPVWSQNSLQLFARVVSGLELFFVLSGFLVAGLLFGEHRIYGTVDVPRFLIRRGLKIYPAFYAFLCVSALTSLAIGVFPKVTLPRVAAEALFVQNYFRGIWSHTWSIAVEEHFYLLLAGVFFWFGARDLTATFSRIPVLVAIVCSLCLVARIITSVLVPVFDFWVHLSPTHLRIDALSVGALLAYLHHKHSAVLSRWIAAYRFVMLGTATGLLGVGAIVPKSTLIGHTVLQVVQYLGHGIIVLLAVYDVWFQRFGRSATAIVLQWIGRNSYSTYLWHMPVLAVVSAAVNGPYKADIVVAVYGILSLPVGWLAAKFVELPVLALRDRYFPSPAGLWRSNHR